MMWSGQVYCDVITRSCLQLINNSIDTFFMSFQLSKEEGRPQRIERKLDGAADKSLAEQQIHKSGAIVHIL